MQKYLLLTIMSLLSLSAFSEEKLQVVARKLQVVATLPVLGDIAKKVGGDFVVVESLAQPNQDPHFVFPTPTLRDKARAADIFIENGMSLELWAQKVVDASANSKIRVGEPGRVVASQGVTALEVPSVLTRAMGDIHPGGNPHVWLDPLNAKIMAKNISGSFARVDPSHKADYARLLKQFESDIDSKMVGWLKKAESLKGTKVITYHRSFVYFANRFGFSIAGEIEEKPGITPGAKHRDALITLMKSEKIDTILQELFYDRVSADFIGEKTGARLIQVPIDVGADPAAGDYFSLIDLLLNRLVEKKS